MQLRKSNRPFKRQFSRVCILAPHQENIFSSSEELIFRTCLDTLALWDDIGPCNNSDKLRARGDCERQTTGKQDNDILADPLSCPKEMPPGIRTSDPSSLKSEALTIVLQDPCLQIILPSHSLSLRWLQGAGVWRGLRRRKIATWFFFNSALVKLRQARLCQKTIFQALKKCFFVCLLSNLPTPPRYLPLARSKSRKYIQYITKNALRIWGTLDQFEGPWASSFQILNQLSGCMRLLWEFLKADHLPQILRSSGCVWKYGIPFHPLVNHCFPCGQIDSV